jgi:hypothetical protein
MPQSGVLQTLRDAEQVAERELRGIRAAIAALAGSLEESIREGRGPSALQGAGRHRQTKRRRLSAAGRKRISDAQKARWTNQRAAGK